MRMRVKFDGRQSCADADSSRIEGIDFETKTRIADLKQVVDFAVRYWTDCEFEETEDLSDRDYRYLRDIYERLEDAQRRIHLLFVPAGEP